MFKRLAAAGVLTAAVGGVLLMASPAMADEPRTVQIIGGQTCRGIEGAGVGGAVHNALGMTHESGDCSNGSTIGR